MYGMVSASWSLKNCGMKGAEMEKTKGYEVGQYWVRSFNVS